MKETKMAETKLTLPCVLNLDNLASEDANG